MMEVLSNDDPKMQLDALRGGFKADISKKQENREERKRRETEVSDSNQFVINVCFQLNPLGNAQRPLKIRAT